MIFKFASITNIISFLIEPTFLLSFVLPFPLLYAIRLISMNTQLIRIEGVEDLRNLLFKLI
jgi:hypothetical protein